MYKVPVIVGPTGVGKSAFAIKYANAIGGEIISCDSRQVYRGMTIGTAKVTRAETGGVEHHCIDILNPDEEYSAGKWAADAVQCLTEILDRGMVPIICGGSFFYLSALKDGFTETTAPDIEFRESSLRYEEAEGAGALHQILATKNPQKALELHPHDVQRIIRVLQMERDGVETVLPNPAFEFLLIEVTMDRMELYERINHRVDSMMERGLFAEFQALLTAGYLEDSPGMKCVGYSEFFNYIDGKMSLSETVELIKQRSRRYAKKQLTWLRNRETPHLTLAVSQLHSAVPLITEMLNSKEVL